MEINEKGLILIKEFEGCKLTAYKDIVGVWTIGYGHTKDVHQGQTITQEQADNFLKDDLKDAENGVNSLVKVPLTQDQFDALVSFTFNLGVGALKGSTLLRMLNDGNYDGASEQFTRWVFAGGKPSNGLIRRRKAEQELFND